MRKFSCDEARSARQAEPRIGVAGRHQHACEAVFHYQFRSAVATSDSWEEHDGMEILFMRSGEACWDLADEHFSMANGSQAVIFLVP